jgi:hypothetical protein
MFCLRSGRLLVVLVVAMALGACGDEGEKSVNGAPSGTAANRDGATTAAREPGASGAGQDDARSDPAPKPLSEEQRAAARPLEQIYEAIDAFESPSVEREDEARIAICESMTESARRETVDYVDTAAGRSDIEWTCESAIGYLAAHARTADRLAGLRRAEILSVAIDGDAAKAVVRFRNGKTSQIPLIRSDGAWLLDSR